MFRTVLTVALCMVECDNPRPGLPALEQLHALADARLKHGTCAEHAWNMCTTCIACHCMSPIESNV